LNIVDPLLLLLLLLLLLVAELLLSFGDDEANNSGEEKAVVVVVVVKVEVDVLVVGVDGGGVVEPFSLGAVVGERRTF